MYTRNEKVEPVYIEDEMRTSYLDYAMSVIVGRALPDVRDGLKPVHRRILYAMRDLGLASNKPYRKCARIVGEVLGKYHPHGDMAVYDSLVRMAQDFSCRYPLIDGQGNFGSVDGDSAAAMRYTEARLSPPSEELLLDIEKETIDFRPNFDDSLTEPKVLPSKLPSLLINGSSGIAVGMATNIPPHNLGEIVDGLVAIIGNPQISVEELMKFVEGPDFPTGALICGREGIKQAYLTGRGMVKMRARVAMEKGTGEREKIVIGEIPYQVNKSRVLENIAALVRDKKMDGIADIRDESDRDGMRIVLETKRGEITDVILNQLYQHTQLEATFGIIMLAIVEGMPRILNLRQILDCFLAHRQEVVTRRTRFELSKAREKAHILEGLKIALDHLDEVIKTIRASRTVEIASQNLMEKFKLSQKQAQAILDMRLQRLTGLERKKVKDDYLETIKLMAKLEAILASPRQILSIIKEELLEMKRKYGDERRTEIIGAVGEVEMEDLIAEEDMVITISHAGYIKRLPVSTYRRQRRGGKGITGAGTKEDDFIEHLFIASTHQYILFFTDRGKVHWLKVYEIPQVGRLSRGKAIPNLLQVEPEEKITAFVMVKEFSDKQFLFMTTEKGKAKKTNLSAYGHPRRGGIVALKLSKEDRLIDVKLTDGEMEVLLATEKGKAIRFKESQVRSVARGSVGVRGISLGKGDRVVGVAIVEEDASVVVATVNGFGKRTDFSEYRVQSRGGKGIINIRTTERNGLVVGFRTVKDQDELMMITSGGLVMRTPVEPIRIIRRNTQGMRLIKLGEGDHLVDMARVVVEKEE